MSPHLDDAVLSAGGVLAARGDMRLPTRVVTIFAGEGDAPFSGLARDFHRDCGLGDGEVLAVRRREDRAALALAGVDARHLGFREALYRRGPEGTLLYTRPRAQFGQRNPQDDALVPELARAIAAEAAELGAVTICAPLGLGDHVDHALVRDAAGLAAAESGLPLLLWADQPYAVLGGIELLASRRSRVTEAQALCGLDAAARYGSQLPMLFGGEPWRELMRDAIAGEWAADA